MAEEVDGCIDPIQIYLWQCLVNQAHISPTGGLRRGKILFQRDLNVFRFALLNFIGHSSWALSYCERSTRRKAVSMYFV